MLDDKRIEFLRWYPRIADEVRILYSCDPIALLETTSIADKNNTLGLDLRYLIDDLMQEVFANNRGEN